MRPLSAKLASPDNSGSVLLWLFCHLTLYSFLSRLLFLAYCSHTNVSTRNLISFRTPICQHLFSICRGLPQKIQQILDSEKKQLREETCQTQTQPEPERGAAVIDLEALEQKLSQLKATEQSELETDNATQDEVRIMSLC